MMKSSGLAPQLQPVVISPISTASNAGSFSAAPRTQEPVTQGPFAPSTGAVRVQGASGDDGLHGDGSVRSSSARFLQGSSPPKAARVISSEEATLGVDWTKKLEACLKDKTDSFLETLEARLAAVEQRVEERLASVESGAGVAGAQSTGVSEATVRHLEGCVEGLLTSSEVQRAEVERMGALIRTQTAQESGAQPLEIQRLESTISTVEALQSQSDSMRADMEKMALAFRFADTRIEDILAKQAATEPDATQAIVDLANCSAELQRSVDMLETRLETQVQARLADVERLERLECADPATADRPEAFQELRRELNELQTSFKEQVDENRAELDFERRARQGEIQRLEDMMQAEARLRGDELRRIELQSDLTGPVSALQDRLEQDFQARIAAVQDQLVSVLADIDATQSGLESLQAAADQHGDDNQQLKELKDALTEIRAQQASQNEKVGEERFSNATKDGGVSRTEVDLYLQEVQALKEAVRDSDALPQSLRAEVDGLRTLVRSELDALQDSLRVCEDQTKTAQSERDLSYGSRLAELQGRIEALNANISAMKDELESSHSSRFGELQGMIEAVQTEGKEAADSAMASHDGHDKRLHHINKRLQEVQAGIEDMRARDVDAANERDSTYRSQFDDLRERTEALHTKCDTIRLQHGESEASLRLQFGDLQGRLETLQVQADASQGLGSEIEALRDKQTAFEGTHQGLSSEFEALRQKHTAFEGTHQGLGSEVEVLRQKQTAFEDTHQGLNSEVEVLRQKHTAFEGIHQGLSSDVEVLRQKQTAFEGTCQGLSSEFEALRQKHTAFEGQAESLNAQIQEGQSGVEALRSNCVDLQAMKSDLDAVKGTQSSQADICRTLEAEMARYRGQLETLITSQGDLVSKGEIEALQSNQTDLDAKIAALRSMIEVARERHGEVDALRSAVAQMQVGVERLQAQSDVASLQRTDRDSTSSKLESADGQSCAETNVSGQATEDLQSSVVRLKAEAQDHRRVTDDLQALLLTLQSQSEATRQQLEEQMKEDTTGVADDLADRLDGLQSRLNSVLAEQGSIRSTAERAERSAKETSGACRQIVEMMPDRREICSISQMSEHVGQLVSEARSDSQQRMELLGQTLTDELARAIPAQAAAQSRVVLAGEMDSWKVQFAQVEKRLTSIEANARSPAADIKGACDLGEVDVAVVQRIGGLVHAHADQLAESERTCMLLRSELDVMRSLQKLSNTKVEDIQERIMQVESRGGGVDVEPMRLFEASVQASLSVVRNDIDTQSIQIEELNNDLSRACLVHDQGLQAVSEGIKDYIQNLILKLDSAQAPPMSLTSAESVTSIDSAREPRLLHPSSLSGSFTGQPAGLARYAHAGGSIVTRLPTGSTGSVVLPAAADSLGGSTSNTTPALSAVSTPAKPAMIVAASPAKAMSVAVPSTKAVGVVSAAVQRLNSTPAGR